MVLIVSKAGMAEPEMMRSSKDVTALTIITAYMKNKK
jgi:hypothetical protein